MMWLATARNLSATAGYFPESRLPLQKVKASLKV
jgi:hypothetical protein